MVIVALASSDGSTAIPWLVPITSIVVVLLGSGGFVAWRRLAHDKKVGIAQQELAEDDAIANRWRAMIETQTVSLLTPMAARLGTLEEKVTHLEMELAESRAKYWSAISYIRSLLTWIARHMPEGVDTTQVPPAPATVVEDI